MIEPRNMELRPESSRPFVPRLTDEGAVVIGRSGEGAVRSRDPGLLLLGAVWEGKGPGEEHLGRPVLLDALYPHVVLVVGVQGSWKSRTVRVLLEELVRSDLGIGTLVFDLRGNHVGAGRAAEGEEQVDGLECYGLEPGGIQRLVRLAPVGEAEALSGEGRVDGAFAVSPSALSADDWCLAFGYEDAASSGPGSGSWLIHELVAKVQRGVSTVVTPGGERVDVQAPPDYTIGDLLKSLENDVGLTSAEGGYPRRTREVVWRRFDGAKDWGIFARRGQPLADLVRAGWATVLDLARDRDMARDRGRIEDAVVSLLVGLLARDVLRSRVAAARAEKSGRGGEDALPVTWLIAEDAHLVAPARGRTPASEALTAYAKQGRSAGCGLVLTAPSATELSDELLSQVDLVLAHTIASDAEARKLSACFAAGAPVRSGGRGGELGSYLRGLPPGYVLVADACTPERAFAMEVRPGMSHWEG